MQVQHRLPERRQVGRVVGQAGEGADPSGATDGAHADAGRGHDGSHGDDDSDVVDAEIVDEPVDESDQK